MKRFLAILVSLLLISNISYSVSYNSDPKIFIKELIGDAIKTLENKSISNEEKNKIIKKIAVENIDIKALGMYTLGDIRKSLEPDVLKQYSLLFEEFFLKSLISRLTDYNSSEFDVVGSEQKSSNTTIVYSRIAESASMPEIKIDWRVYTKDPLKPLIRDLVVEGLSMARAQKEEFSSILNSNNRDIQVLLRKLETFIAG
jgi:phospholipid transport system substrate-binding protein